MKSEQLAIGEEEIARRAYDIWQARGCPPGDGTADWHAAEAQLMAARIRRGNSTQERAQSWWQRVRKKVRRPTT